MVLNQEFRVLQTIAILTVVIGHRKDSALSFLAEWFPIYSYHMPLFMFISGYFYRAGSEEKIGSFIVRKIKTLIIPYFLWRAFYFIVVFFLGGNFEVPFRLYMFFYEPWVFDNSIQPIIPAWFVLSLFCVQVVFCLLRKLFLFCKLKNEIIFLLIFFLLGLLSVYYANLLKGSNSDYSLISTLIRAFFFLPVYQFGFLYKMKFEGKKTLPSLAYFAILFALQFVLLKMFGALTFDVYRCSFSNFIFLPYLSSLTGILFWLRISKILARALKGNRIVRYIGQNTWTVMMHHIFSFFLVNSVIFILSKPLYLTGFDTNAFLSNMWYTYSPGLSQFSIVYVVAGVALPLLAKYGVERLILHIDAKRTIRLNSKPLN